MTPPLRDYRDPRDWRRWKDPPGWFPCCCADECTPACTPDFADVGTVGSESGDECTTCGTQDFLDDFSSALDTGVWSGACGGTIGSGSTEWKTSGGVLIPGQNNIKTGFNRPPLSGFCVQIKATITTLPTSGIHGIVLGYGRMFFPRQDFGNYGRQSKIDADGCILSGSDFATFGPVPANGDVISMIFRDQGGADGICSVCYQVNGTTIRVEEDIQFCFDCFMYAGMRGTAAVVGAIDDFEIRVST